MKWTMECILSGLGHLVDGGVTLRFNNLKDLTNEEKIVLLNSHNKTGYLAFSEDEIQESDIPKHDTDCGKTPSQRLRGVLFKLWQQTDGVSDFEVYYRQRMEKLINMVKEKLE